MADSAMSRRSAGWSNRRRTTITAREMSPNARARVPKIANSTSPLTIISTGATTSRYPAARPSRPARCSSRFRSLRANSDDHQAGAHTEKREQSVRVPLQSEPAGVHRAHRCSRCGEQDCAQQRRQAVPHERDYCHCKALMSGLRGPTTTAASRRSGPISWIPFSPCDFLLADRTPPLRQVDGDACHGWMGPQPPTSLSGAVCAWIRACLSRRQGPGEAELVPVGVGQVKVPLAPFSVARRRLWS